MLVYRSEWITVKYTVKFLVKYLGFMSTHFHSNQMSIDTKFWLFWNRIIEL